VSTRTGQDQFAIHAGDPGPEGVVDVDDTTVLLAGALSARLREVSGLGPATADELSDRLAGTGIMMGAAGAGAPRLEEFKVDGTIVCTKVFRGTYCFLVPKVTNWAPPPGRSPVALGDRIRRSLATVRAEERDRLRDAILTLNQVFCGPG
jgi:hypothetical protein